MRSPARVAVLAAILALAPVAALAQSATGPANPPGRDCVPGSAGGAPCPSLTEKLDRTDGVLKPPGGIDPEIHTGAPAPNPGTTPVIPPSALPDQQAPAKPQP
ncbi:hypothetical protein [Prosthecomicrobium sp. N25]|uniref:hypothetical protein n=1 Tax=Prosthecomicrobium sp. N25 TaxID=3129254 RepID=UPI00307752F8